MKYSRKIIVKLNFKHSTKIEEQFKCIIKIEIQSNIVIDKIEIQTSRSKKYNEIESSTYNPK